MSTEKLRELKLYKKLQKELTYRQKLQQKIRQISNPQTSSESSHASNKLNQNKKYLQQQQKNAQIEKQNRILFEKIKTQGMRSQYYNKSRSKNHSSKTLNSMQDYEDQKSNHNERKYNNYSQNKIHYMQEQSRISFQQNQELVRPKSNNKAKKIITELSPQVLEAVRSRMIQGKLQSKETILFQGIAEIDSIRFKVRIVLRGKIYLLTGKNKHTEIMLKMQLSQYKKFHKQVLEGNPSNIFQYLVIDKGKIRFRTIEQQQTAEFRKRIYQIEEEEDQENQDGSQKYQKGKKFANSIHPFFSNKHHYLEENYGIHPEEEQIQKYVRQRAKFHSSSHFKPQKNSEKINKKSNVFHNINKKHPEFSEKHKTLQDYINNKDLYHVQAKDIQSTDSTGVGIRDLKDRYKLPYL